MNTIGSRENFRSIPKKSIFKILSVLEINSKLVPLTKISYCCGESENQLRPASRENSSQLFFSIEHSPNLWLENVVRFAKNLTFVMQS
ncbi:unnamed protein product [Rotaria socialis]